VSDGAAQGWIAREASRIGARNDDVIGRLRAAWEVLLDPMSALAPAASQVTRRVEEEARGIFEAAAVDSGRIARVLLVSGRENELRARAELLQEVSPLGLDARNLKPRAEKLVEREGRRGRRSRSRAVLRGHRANERQERVRG
jgi:hypothetical protein